MSTNNSTPPNAIDLALDALRECERLWSAADDYNKTERIYQRSIAEREAERQMQRAGVLANVATAQAVAALANVLADATEADDDPPATLYEQMRAEIDGLRQQLVKADADNAALIAQLHPDEHLPSGWQIGEAVL